MVRTNPYFLKVTGMDEEHGLSQIEAVTKSYAELVNKWFRSCFATEGSKIFGYFGEVLRGKNYICFSFSPYSADSGKLSMPTAYATQKSALNAAIRFWDAAGFKAIVVDLEKMLDEI